MPYHKWRSVFDQQHPSNTRCYYLGSTRVFPMLLHRSECYPDGIHNRVSLTPLLNTLLYYHGSHVHVFLALLYRSKCSFENIHSQVPLARCYRAIAVIFSGACRACSNWVFPPLQSCTRVFTCPPLGLKHRRHTQEKTPGAKKRWKEVEPLAHKVDGLATEFAQIMPSSSICSQAVSLPLALFPSAAHGASTTLGCR